VLAGFVMAGLPGLLGTVLAQVPAKRSRLAVAGVLVTAGSLVTAATFLRDGPGFIPDASDLLVGTGAIAALVTGLAGDGDDSR
jgi:hypothetical protein